MGEVQGRSYGLFLALSLILGWFVTIIAVAVLPAKEKAEVEPQATPEPKRDPGGSTAYGLVDDSQMRMLLQLREGGALTPEQFAEEQARIERERSSYGPG